MSEQTLLPPPPLGSDEEAAMTYDEISMQQSTHFLHNLQELKNLRPQLYSAAEYCELSYLNSDRKQMIVDNLKDYAVKALVNTVDHLGSVAYKLNDHLKQQSNEISATQLRISCLQQRLRTCQEYTDWEGLRQQCLVERIPRYHKHYVLPGSAAEDFEASAEKLSDREHDDEETTTQSVRSGTLFPLSTCLLLDGARAALNTNSGTPTRNESRSMFPDAGSEVFFFPEAEVSIPSFSARFTRSQSTHMTPGFASNSFATGQQDVSEAYMAVSMVLPVEENGRLEIRRPPARSRSLLSYFLSRRKSVKQKSSRVL